MTPHVDPREAGTGQNRSLADLGFGVQEPEGSAPPDTTTTTVVVPGTGQVVALDGTPDQLVGVAREIDDFISEVRAAKQQLVDELARRIDTTGRRSVEVDGLGKLEANPAVTDEYRPDEVTSTLAPLVQDGLLGQEVLDQAVYLPPPRRPDPRVSRKVMQALAKHADARVRDAVKELAVETEQRRVVKLDGKTL